MPIQAPAERTFPVVEQGTYDATIESVTVLDFSTSPFQINPQFKPRYGYQLEFKWLLDGVTDEQGFSISIPLYAWLETGDRPVSNGPRKGRLPQLTEITRALGEPDIQPETFVDEQAWVGKAAQIGVLLEPKNGGGFRNKINAVSAKRKAPGASGVVARPVAKPAARPAAQGATDDPNGDVPF